MNAVLQVWYPGARGGKAAADLLFGACSPSGKLPVTFYRDLDGFPAFEDYSMKGRTYRYLEKEPLYPFGYGLTYGRVEVCGASLADQKEGNASADAYGRPAGRPASAGQPPAAEKASNAGQPSDIGQPVVRTASGRDLAVKAVLENTGAYDTDEVLQAYIRAEDSAFAPWHPALCAFRRVSLKAGERKEVCLTVPASALTIVDEEGRRYVDGKRFSLYIGTSQPDERSAALTGMRPVRIDIVL